MPAVWKRIQVTKAFPQQDEQTIKDLVNLIGGIPYDDFISFAVQIEQPTASVIKVRITCNRYEAWMRVDNQEKQLSFTSLEVEEAWQKKGIATSLLVNMVQACEAQGYDRISLYASGGWGIPRDGNWNNIAQKGYKVAPPQFGYYTWGRLGFMMDETGQKHFESWTKHFQLQGKTVTHFLCGSTPGFRRIHRPLWLYRGFGWDGYFNIGQGECHTILQQYLQERP